MLRPDTLALTALLALLTALGPLSTDMYLPSLPILSLDLGSTPAGGQLTLSAFMFGFAAGQIFYGPVSDRFGRKPVLLFGLGLFSVASAACAVAPSIETLVVARFFQALGACGPIVLARSIVRDLYSGPRAGRELARMASIMTVVPAAAPLIGGVLEAAFGWRASFFAELIFGVGAALAVIIGLPETAATRGQEPLSIRSVMHSFGVVAGNRVTRIYIGLIALGYAGIFTWLSASSFVLQGIYGLSEMAFAISFVGGVVGFLGGSLSGPRLQDRGWATDRIIGLGCFLQALGGIFMMLAVITDVAPVPTIIFSMAVYLAGVGCSFPQNMAGAMQRHPDRAGAASSLSGFVQMSSSAILGMAVGQMLGSSALPLAVVLAAVGICAFALERSTRATRMAG